MNPSIEFRCISTLEEMKEIEQDWCDLYRLKSAAPVHFQSFDWCYTWVRENSEAETFDLCITHRRWQGR